MWSSNEENYKKALTIEKEREAKKKWKKYWILLILLWKFKKEFLSYSTIFFVYLFRKRKSNEI